jgi:putative ABC transport system substrate-binding protein
VNLKQAAVRREKNMRQRSFLCRLFESALLALCCLLAGPRVSWAQSASFRIGVLTPGGTFDPVFLGLKEGLERLDYRQEKNLALNIEDTQGAASDLVERARKVLDAKPDVFFAVTTPHAIAARQATTTVPVVFAWVGDPVRTGLVASYSSSKSNLTGVASYSAPLSGKRLEILKEIAPGTKRVLAIVAAKDVNAELSFEFLQETARKLRIQVVRREAKNKQEIDKVLAETLKGSVDAIYYVPSTLVGAHIELLINKSKEHKIPLMVNEGAMVEQGALCAYGADFRLIGAQAARLVAKILKGEKPSEIPTETPGKLLFVLNTTTAKSIGLKIPRKVLDRIDRIVE